MKKYYLLIIVLQLFVSCAGINHKSSTVVYEAVPADSYIYLRSVKIMPEIILTDISAEIPELIRSCLKHNGFSNTKLNSDNAYKLDVFLNSRTWQHQYKSVESVTLSIRLYRDDSLIAYRIYTEDTEESIESFLWTFNFIEKNIHEFSLAAGSDE